MRPDLSCALLIILCTAVQTAVCSHVQTLVPFDFLNGQLIELDTGVHIYRLSQLKPDTGYEVRVSFPASIPATVKYRLLSEPVQQQSAAAAAASEPGGQEALSLGRLGRRLLDTEKFTFRTGPEGGVQGIAEPQLELRAYRRSVHREGPQAGAPKLVYNIVLAELVLGVAKDTLPVVLTVVAVVLITLVWSIVWSNRLFPQLLDYLTADNGGSSSSKGKASSGSTAAVAAAVATAVTSGASAAAPRKGTGRSSSTKRSS